MGHFAAIFGYGNSRDNERGGGGLTALLMLFLAPLAAMLLQLGISRQREYAADETGAKTGRAAIWPDQSIAETWSLQSAHSEQHSGDDCGAMHREPMFGGGSVWASLFSTHPPLEDRDRCSAGNDHQPSGLTLKPARCQSE